MPQPIPINGITVSYPVIGDVEWGVEATKFAELVGIVLNKLGQGSQSTTNNITIAIGNLTVTTGNTDLGGTLDVTGATNLDSTLDVTGVTNLDSTLDVTGVTTIVDDLIVDTDTLFVDVSTDRVGINTATPTVALDVVGSAAISGTLTAGTFAPKDLTVDTNLIKTNSTDNYVGINTTTPTEALDVTGKVLVSSDITIGGVIVADDSTNVTTAPPITFTGDTNTGIGHSAADTLDLVTGGQPRFRIEPTGQIKAVYESQVGTDYNTQLDNGYLCRAWVNFNGTGTVAIRASGNVSSITDNGTGDYTVNFASPMPDSNYSVNINARAGSGYVTSEIGLFKQATNTANNPSVGSFRFLTTVRGSGGVYDGLSDADYICVGVFR
jgi:hypothetical protein